MFPFQPPSTPLQNNISPSQTRLSERVYYIECKLTNCLESAIFHRTCGLGKRNASNVDFSLRKKCSFCKKKQKLMISSELKIKHKEKRSLITRCNFRTSLYCCQFSVEKWRKLPLFHESISWIIHHFISATRTTHSSNCPKEKWKKPSRGSWKKPPKNVRCLTQ